MKPMEQQSSRQKLNLKQLSIWCTLQRPFYCIHVSKHKRVAR